MSEDMPELLEDRLAAMQARVHQLETQVASLMERVDELSRVTAAGSPGASPAKPPGEAEAVSTAQRSVSTISPGMIEVISLLHQGHGDEAQRKLHELPEKELAEQPAIVALVAAALCAQRDDYPTALTALNHARQLTDDPRLLKVIQLVETRVS